MLRMLIRLMFLAALIESGIGISETRNCHSRKCLAMIEARSRDVLGIDWKPISVFPDEAARFK